MIDRVFDCLPDCCTENVLERTVRGDRSAIRPVQILPGEQGLYGSNRLAIRPEKSEGGFYEGFQTAELAVNFFILREKKRKTDDAPDRVAWDIGHLCRHGLHLAGEPAPDQGTCGARGRLVGKGLEKRGRSRADSFPFWLVRLDRKRV